MAIDLREIKWRQIKRKDWLEASHYQASPVDADLATLLAEVDHLQQQLGQARELLAYCRDRLTDEREKFASDAYDDVAHRLAAIVGED